MKAKLVFQAPADQPDNALKTHFLHRIPQSQHRGLSARGAGEKKNITKADLNPAEMTSALCDKLHTNIYIKLNPRPPADTSTRWIFL